MLDASESSTSTSAHRVLTPHEARIEGGVPMGLAVDPSESKRARIQRMLHGFRDTPIRLNVERARLLTESMKRTEGLSLIHISEPTRPPLLSRMPSSA